MGKIFLRAAAIAPPGVVRRSRAVADTPALHAAREVPLLERMRAGDREAAAEFMAANADLIRRRYRRKLGPGMRRLFDSMELLSTITRRLDRCIRAQSLRAESDVQLWALIYQIADNCLTNRVKIYARLKEIEGGGEDSEIVRLLTDRMRAAESMATAHGPEVELESVFALLDDQTDREILSGWLRGQTHAITADQLSMTEDAVKKRWQRVRQSLRDSLEDRGTTGKERRS